MSRVLEGPSLTPVEAMLDAHPDVRVGLYNLSNHDERRYFATHYFVSGNLSDGRFGVVGIGTTSGDMIEGGYESVLNLTAKAFRDRHAVRFSSDGPVVLQSETQRDPELNTLRVSMKNKRLVVEAEIAEGEDSVDPEEIRFLALKGMALLDTLERFGTPDEKVLAPGVVSSLTEPFIYNAHVSNANGFMRDRAEMGMDIQLSALTSAIPELMGLYTIGRGAGRPYRIRHILKHIEIPQQTAK